MVGVGRAAAAGPVVKSLSPASGTANGGATVTIAGSGLAGATAVTFGGVPATSFTDLTGIKMTAVVPPAAAKSAAAVEVVVTVGGVNSTPQAPGDDTFTYTWSGTPAVTGYRAHRGDRDQRGHRRQQHDGHLHGGGHVDDGPAGGAVGLRQRHRHRRLPGDRRGDGIVLDLLRRQRQHLGLPDRCRLAQFGRRGGPDHRGHLGPASSAPTSAAPPPSTSAPPRTPTSPSTPPPGSPPSPRRRRPWAGGHHRHHPDDAGGHLPGHPRRPTPSPTSRFRPSPG